MLFNKLLCLERILAKNLSEILNFDDWLHEEFSCLSDRLTPILIESHAPITSFSLIGLLATINSIKLGMYDLIEKCDTHLYVVKILHRSLIEQFLRFQYLFSRFINENNDEVGIEYRKYSKISEVLAYINASAVANSMVGKATEEIVLKKLKKDFPELSISRKELESITNRWKHRSIIKYLNTNSRLAEPGWAFMLNLIPEYAELSSFVHGGTSAEEHYNYSMSEGSLKEQMLNEAEEACRIAALTKGMLLIVATKFSPEFQEDLDLVMSKLLEFSCT